MTKTLTHAATGIEMWATHSEGDDGLELWDAEPAAYTDQDTGHKVWYVADGRNPVAGDVETIPRTAFDVPGGGKVKARLVRA